MIWQGALAFTASWNVAGFYDNKLGVCGADFS